jgi:LacI family fructose operon transcriptional repressor
MIGMIVSDITNPFFSAVSKAAEQTARQRGYFAIVCNTNENVDQERQYPRVVSEQLVDGFIISPCVGNHAHLARLAAERKHVVVFNRAIDVDTPTLVMDNERAAYDLTAHLTQAGYRRISVVAGLEEASTTQRRIHGHKRALSDAGLVFEPDRVLYTSSTFEGGYAAGRAALAAEQVEAVLTFNTPLAEGVLHALTQTQPGILPALAGFDVPSWASLLDWPYSCNAISPVSEFGMKAVTVLLDWIEKGVTRPQRTQQLPVRITTHTRADMHHAYHRR